MGITFLLFDLQTRMRDQNGVEFYQESTCHVGFFLGLLLAEIANERLNFARNLMIMVQDMCHISFYAWRERGLTNGYGHLSIYCFSAINIENETLMLTLNIYFYISIQVSIYERGRS